MHMNFFRSSIGHKFIMAVSGCILLLFVIFHLIGNLGVFNGQEAFNDYSAFLASVPKLLWMARIGLLVAFVLHVYTSIRLSIDNKSARPKGYAKKSSVAATFASRTMLFSGLLLLSFIVYHLAHFTWLLTNPEYEFLRDNQNRPDTYGMVVSGFQNVYVVAFYFVAQVFLALHLSHGFASAARTFGAQSRAFAIARTGGKILTLAIFLLYVSIPLAVLTGFISF